MKNYTKLFAPFLLAFLVGSLTLMFAQTKNGSGERPPRGGDIGAPGGFGGPGGGFLHPRLLEQLNLTDAQKTQIAALQEAARTASQTYLERLRVVQDQIRDISGDGTFNETEARTLLRTKADIQIELELIRLRTEAGIYSLLTAEQIALLEQLKQQRPEPPRGGNRPGAARN